MTQTIKTKFAFGAFALAAIVTLGVSVFSSAFAATDSTTGEVEVTVAEVLTIELSESTVYLDANAAVNDGLAQENTQVTVGTNNAAGAGLYVEMNSNMASNYLPGDTVPSNTIAATTPGANLSNNSWGYKAFQSTPSSTWSAMNSYGTPALIFDDSTIGAGMNAPGETTWTFEFGVQIDYTMPADTYSGTILYTATTN